MGEIKVQVTPNKPQSLQVGTKNVKTPINIEENPTHYYSTLAKQWATQMGGMVQNEDFSSKYYANESKKQAEVSQVAAETASNFVDLLENNYTNYSNQLNELGTETLSEITELRENSVAEIEQKHISAIEDITAAKADAIENINDVNVNAQNEITQTKDNALNQIQTEADTQIAKIESTGIDTRANTDLTNLSEVGEKHFLNKNQISNCITEIPDNIKYEINSAGRIILKEGSTVYVSTNGTFEAVTLSSDTAEGAGGLWTTAHNRSLFVVYVPDTNSVQAHALDYTYAQTTAPTTFLTGYALWYNTDTKVIKATIDSGANWQICSLPIMIGRPGESNIGWRGYVDNVFNGMGFVNTLTFVLPGVRALFADGRNSDGTLKNKEVTSKTVQMNNLTTQTSRLGQLEVSNNSLLLYGYGVTNYFEQETPPSGFGQHATWYNIRENELYSTSDSGVTWNKKYTIILPKLTKSSTTASISDICMPYALKFADINDVLNRTDMPLLKSSNGYTKLPNGIIIQWGRVTAAGDGTGTTVTFPVAFTNTNYTVTVNPTADTSEQNCVMGKTSTTFRVNSHGHGGSSFYNANPVNWLAIGY